MVAKSPTARLNGKGHRHHIRKEVQQWSKQNAINPAARYVCTTYAHWLATLKHCYHCRGSGSQDREGVRRERYKILCTGPSRAAATINFNRPDNLVRQLMQYDRHCVKIDWGGLCQNLFARCHKSTDESIDLKIHTPVLLYGVAYSLDFACASDLSVLPLYAQVVYKSDGKISPRRKKMRCVTRHGPIWNQYK